ncbi:hypothetical protein FB45DRAFT_1054426 [Roridomyces roridus]|uniref:F-box domain-containing protein n=1 Tax=Roridomyces roridus TaxID=1738132 RepID=A0AAD7CAW0_9AGAR|nr:hypothetical protein FB45DRAFT_1054426 [Roridomyces roridus]
MSSLVCPMALLPPEVATLVFNNIEETSHLLECSLVCRSWVTFSRSNLKLAVFKGPSTACFAELLACPTNTLAPTLTELRLYTSNVEPLLPALGAFPFLRVLELGYCTVTEKLPALPSLTSLTLKLVQFQTSGVFHAHVASLPLLQTLSLFGVSCTDAGDGDAMFEETDCSIIIPSLQLQFFADHVIDKRILFALYAQNLTLLLHDTPAHAWLSEFLVHLGAALRTLKIVTLPNWQPDDILAQLDLSANVNLVDVEARTI